MQKKRQTKSTKCLLNQQNLALVIPVVPSRILSILKVFLSIPITRIHNEVFLYQEYIMKYSYIKNT
jgi:hypothetical protein